MTTAMPAPIGSPRAIEAALRAICRDADAPVDGAAIGDPAIVDALGDVRAALRRGQREKLGADRRLDELMGVMLRIAGLDFEARAHVGEDGDAFDALALGLNMLAEELQATTVGRSYLEAVLASMGDALVTLDAKGGIDRANAAAERLLGVPSAALHGRDAKDFFVERPGGLPRPEALAATIAQRPITNQLTMVRGASGEPIPVSLNIEVLRDAGGAHVGVVATARDMRHYLETQAKLEASLAELRAAEEQLVESSRRAGMAEVASGVLHNVGNVLNSLNTSASLLLSGLRTSRLPMLGKTLQLLEQPPQELARFLTADERGRALMPYLGKLTEHLEREHAHLLAEMAELSRHLVHVNAIISRQQDYARNVPTIERTSIGRVLDDVLGLDARHLEAAHVHVVRELAELPALLLDRHSLAAILTNFVVNARQSLERSEGRARRLTIHAFQNARGWLQIDVTDDGIGIPADVLPRLFTFGFTTKDEGHGLGLASSLLAARSMGGSLRASSEGPGHGATFTVELPFRPAPDEVPHG